MKKLIFVLGLLLLFTTNLWATSPARVYTYSTGETIDPAKVTSNEDVIFSYLSTGVDTYFDGSIVNADISGSAAITYGKLSLGSSLLSSDIKDGEIVSADRSSSAAIPYSKLTFSNNIVAGDIAVSAVASSEILDDTIVNADINSSAAIVDTKLYTISTAGKVLGSALNTLSGIPSGAGQIPVANLGTGTGSSSNYLRGDGAWTTGTFPTQVNDTDAGTSFDDNPEVTFLSVAKTITSGNTVLLIASGYYAEGTSDTGVITIKLKQGSTTVQTIVLGDISANTNRSWSACGIATGLSGAITFSVTAQGTVANLNTIYGNLVVLEF